MLKIFDFPIGITAYSSYVPGLKMAVDMIDAVKETSITHKISSKRKSSKDSNYFKAVADKDEDVNSFSLNIVSDIVDSFPKVQTKKIGSIYVGSESFAYAVKPVAGMLGDYLGVNNTTGADMQFACKAGTAAIQVVTAQVASGMVDMGVAIGVDISQAKVGDVLERNTGAGGAGFVVGADKSQIIARIIGTASVSSDTPDFWRRAGEKYPVHTARFSSSVGYIKHVSSAIELLFEKTNYKPSDFNYVVFHSPNEKLPDFVGDKFGFNQKSMVHRKLFPQIGNAYAGSSMLGLSHALDVAKTGDLILMVSYGSGAGSDAFIFQVTGKIGKNRAKRSLVSHLKDRTEISYTDYLNILKII